MARYGKRSLPAWTSGSHAFMTALQKAHDRNGTALTGHRNNAHAGQHDDNCRACKELLARYNAAQEVKS